MSVSLFFGALSAARAETGAADFVRELEKTTNGDVVFSDFFEVVDGSTEVVVSRDTLTSTVTFDLSGDEASWSAIARRTDGICVLTTSGVFNISGSITTQYSPGLSSFISISGYDSWTGRSSLTPFMSAGNYLKHLLSDPHAVSSVIAGTFEGRQGLCLRIDLLPDSEETDTRDLRTFELWSDTAVGRWLGYRELRGNSSFAWTRTVVITSWNPAPFDLATAAIAVVDSSLKENRFLTFSPDTPDGPFFDRRRLPVGRTLPDQLWKPLIENIPYGSLLNSQTIVILFSTLNCYPCETMLTRAVDSAKSATESGEMIPVVVYPYDDQAKARAKLADLKVPFSMATLPLWDIRSLGVWTYPTTVTVDRRTREILSWSEKGYPR